MKLLGIPLLFALAGCPIAPDFGPDGGTDGGLDAGTDAGMDAGVDAGVDGGASGNADCVFTTSTSASPTNLAWSGSDFKTTSIDAEGGSGPSQVTISAANGLSGSFRITLGNLVPNQTSGNVLNISYQPASGPDSWNCSASTVACSVNASLSGYDGSTIAGNFGVAFPQDAFGVSSSLTSGSFIVTLP